MEIKLSNYVAKFIKEQGTKYVFVLQGGAVAHLIDSIATQEDLEYVVVQHEQSAAMAADSYSRIQNLGVAFATSGPGATNLITGIACAYYDSIPVLYITGNVASFRQSEKFNVRQYGFQENNIVDMVKSITKYAVRIEKPQDIIEELEKAVEIARMGRQGPVLIDIPDDFQRVIIDTAIKKNNMASPLKIDENLNFTNEKILSVYNLLKDAKRPVLVLGAGIISSKSLVKAKELVKTLNIPILHTWALKGIFNYFDAFNFGSFGTNSNRSGNFIVQNADLIIAIGTRLDTHATGKIESFAREAKIILNDIDHCEIEKFKLLNREIDLELCGDASSFLEMMLKLSQESKIPVYDDWIKWCQIRKNNFLPRIDEKIEKVNPFSFLSYISNITNKIKIITVDTGASLAYVMCAYEEREDQKFITAFNNTPMGYSLPAAIGASFATDKKEQILCFSGDGGFQMNIQELATIAYYKLPIKIIIFNNYGHAMIKQTQDDWLDSRLEASSSKKGIPSISFSKIAEAYGIQSVTIDTMDKINLVDGCFLNDEPCLIEVILDESLRVMPMLKYGYPIEDSNPLLSREILKQNMIIDLYKE